MSDSSKESSTRVVVELIINGNCGDEEDDKDEADLHDVVDCVHQDYYKRSQKRVHSHVSVKMGLLVKRVSILVKRVSID